MQTSYKCAMEKGYRDKLFDTYRETHGMDCIELDKAFEFFNFYYEKYYKRYFDRVKSDAQILEIGCNAGYMLRVLDKKGYANVTGIDLSPEDIAYANAHSVGGGIAICIDAFEYLKNCNKKYHVIYSKAVLEHIPKENTFELLALINDHLEDDGIVMIDVPNMDWIWAAHERYMDFTHETGYTKESLGQVMRSFFTEVNIDYVDNSERFHGIKSFFARKIFGLLLYWSEPVIEPQNFFSRCILGVGKKKKQ